MRLARVDYVTNQFSLFRKLRGTYVSWIDRELNVPMLASQTSEELETANKLLNWVAFSCVCCGVVWAAFIHYHLGPCVTVMIPLSFSLVVGPLLVVNQFVRIGKILAKAQSLAIIFVPWGIQLSLGGYASGMAIIWGLLGPLCGMFFLSKRVAVRLFIIFLVNALIAIVGDVELSGDSRFATDTFVRTFYAMNITLPSLVTFVALWYSFNKLNTNRLKVAELLNTTEERNKDLIESINYAEYLQHSILPSYRKFRTRYAKSFLFLKPKDIVSGDFFWFKEVGDLTYFAVCDSTGHGVPGSLISIICNRSLCTAIDEFGLTDPGAILEKTRELVMDAFANADSKVSDGMDVALCCLDGEMILFAGAKHSLHLLRSDTGVLEELKGTRQSIGYSIGGKKFTTHVRRLRPGDRLFLTTDGYLDQFGGPYGKKFKSREFKLLIQNTKDLSVEQQGVKITSTLEDWMSGHAQVDDICVMGIEVYPVKGSRHSRKVVHESLFQ